MINQKNISATCSEICEYVGKEVSSGDIVRLSLGRCYIPGKVISNNQGVLQIGIDGDMTKEVTCIDIKELKDFLVELEHECKSGIYTIEAKND